MESLSLQQTQERLSELVQFKKQNKTNVKFEVGTTKDYGLFKFFNYNRAIKRANLKAIKKAIQKRGLIMPILVTKDFKVIDGQHRLLALEELGMEIHYVIAHDYISNDVEEVNNVGQNWDIRARVNNLAEHGNVNFIELLNMYKEWGHTFSEGAINDAFFKTGANSSKAIRDKSYTIDKNLGAEVLENAMVMNDIVIKATQSKFVRALKSVMISNSNFDIDTLRYKAESRRLNVYNNESEIKEEIIEVYNYRTREVKRIK
jgi:hypothetical protein